jgi:hypothetical protein
MLTSTTRRHSSGRRNPDAAHHHPNVHAHGGGWVWSCSCGSRTGRTSAPPASWRVAVVEALRHSTELAA